MELPLSNAPANTLLYGLRVSLEIWHPLLLQPLAAHQRIPLQGAILSEQICSMASQSSGQLTREWRPHTNSITLALLISESWFFLLACNGDRRQLYDSVPWIPTGRACYSTSRSTPAWRRATGDGQEETLCSYVRHSFGRRVATDKASTRQPEGAKGGFLLSEPGRDVRRRFTVSSPPHPHR